jgi:ABC-type nickel/cobalt efflux system permease component RcnA/ABC-type uncharacterized transport system substrate-binding protein
VSRFLAIIAVALALIAPTPPAVAHPHVFTDVASDLVIDAEGRLTAIRHRWTFDEVYSAFARQGFDANRDNVYSREELQALAEVNVTSVAEFAYFTFVLVEGAARAFDRPTEYFLENDANSGQLTLHFTLPLRVPVDLRTAPALVKVFDPEYFVAFELVESDPVKIAVGAPAACRFEVQRPRELDADAAAELGQIPASQRQLPPELQALTAGLSNDIAIDCSGRSGSLLAAVGVPPQTPGGSNGSRPRQIGLSDLPALVTEGAPPAVRSQPGFFAHFFARVAAIQADIYRQFGETIRAVRADTFALLALLALAFGYGVLHAAGPGHGKVVISSYLLATNQTLKRGIVIAVASALVQGAVAVAIVGTLAIVLEATSQTMTRVSGIVEIASYALVVAIGAVLLARKLRALAPRAQPATLSAAAVAHMHDASCAHDHAPDPRLLQGHFDLRAAAAAVLAVGIRPCTGAILILVFALAQGVLAAGLLAVLAMSLGTGLTVAALATVAVTAKGLAVKLAARRSQLSVWISHAIEVMGAVLVLGFGLMFLTAALIYGPMGG